MPMIDTENIRLYTYCSNCDDDLDYTVTSDLMASGDLEYYITVQSCSCGYPDTDEIYDDGYESGRESGYEDGFDDGKSEGIDEATCVRALILKDHG